MQAYFIQNHFHIPTSMLTVRETGSMERVIYFIMKGVSVFLVQPNECKSTPQNNMENLNR